MRSTKQTQILKSGTRTKISKKKNARKSNGSWGFNNNVSNASLENINEILRKTQRAEGRGSWKLLPKDSCEVYKERRRKQLESQEQQSDESNIAEDSRKRTRRDKTRQKEIDRRVKKKSVRNTRRNRRRPHSESTVPSCTSCSSMSTSCASTSDMEY